MKSFDNLPAKRLRVAVKPETEMTKEHVVYHKETSTLHSTMVILSSPIDGEDTLN